MILLLLNYQIVNSFASSMHFEAAD